MQSMPNLVTVQFETNYIPLNWMEGNSTQTSTDINLLQGDITDVGIDVHEAGQNESSFDTLDEPIVSILSF